MDVGDRRRLVVQVGNVAVALVVTAVAVVSTSRLDPNAGERSPDVLAYAAIAVAGGSLLVRRRWPLLVAGAVAGALVVYLARDYVGDAILLTGPVALYAVAAGRERRVGYTAAGAMAGLVVAVGLVVDDGPGALDLLFVAWAAVAVLAADAVRAGRERQEAREHETQRRVAEERLRIARDLHDTVAHSMATINVQSGVAAHVLDSRPAQAQAALEIIRQASADVLDEMTALLGLLRDEPGSPAEPVEPVAGLERLDPLVDSSRQAGLPVDLAVIGSPEAVPHSVGTAAYRIVQEALTNVVRHAGAARATVRVACGDDGSLKVEVSDDGQGGAVTAGDYAGRGILGMRERVAATGGELLAGPAPGGGFRVAASWPSR